MNSPFPKVGERRGSRVVTAVKTDGLNRPVVYYVCDCGNESRILLLSWERNKSERCPRCPSPYTAETRRKMQERHPRRNRVGEIIYSHWKITDQKLIDFKTIYTITCKTCGKVVERTTDKLHGKPGCLCRVRKAKQVQVGEELLTLQELAARARIPVKKVYGLRAKGWTTDEILAGRRRNGCPRQRGKGRREEILVDSGTPR